MAQPSCFLGMQSVCPSVCCLFLYFPFAVSIVCLLAPILFRMMRHLCSSWWRDFNGKYLLFEWELLKGFQDQRSKVRRHDQTKRNAVHKIQLRWWSGVVVSALASINEVNQRRARLVLRWVTVSRFNSRLRTFISLCD